MIAWVSIISVGICLLTVATFILTRQVGYLVAAKGVTAARDDGEGPRHGEDLFRVLNLDEENSPPASSFAVLFISANCNVCSTVTKAAEKIAGHWPNSRIIVMIDEDSYIRELLGVLEVRYSSADVRRNLNIGYVPFGIGLSQHGLVIARGLVNNASHVESLLETCEKEKTL